MTTRDTAVSPRKQRELADALGARVYEVGLDHLQLVDRAGEYNPALLAAIAQIVSAEPLRSAPAAR